MAEQEKTDQPTEDAEAQNTDAEEEASAEATGDAASDEPAADESADAEEQPVADAEPAVEGADVIAEQATMSTDVLEGHGEDEGRNMRKERVGIVVSAKMEKTIVVSIERSKRHPMYKKYLTRSARKMTHDENNEAGEGDTVRIMETRPISKHKRWRLVEILERAA